MISQDTHIDCQLNSQSFNEITATNCHEGESAFSAEKDLPREEDREICHLGETPFSSEPSAGFITARGLTVTFPYVKYMTRKVSFASSLPCFWNGRRDE